MARRTGIDLETLSTRDRFASKAAYKKTLRTLQKRLQSVQQAYKVQDRRAVLVFEGWDAAGNGGTINRITERLNTNYVKVWPIGEPTPQKQARHYMFRFWERLPDPGTIAVFDRSWYGRVLVEGVERLATEAEWKRAYREINEFERTLHDDGVRILKFFLHISADTQRRRFIDRLKTPYKRWKITASDVQNHAKRDDYLAAFHDMLEKTDTDYAPWTVVPADLKWTARINIIETVIAELSGGVDLRPPRVEGELKDSAKAVLGLRDKDFK